MKTKIQLKTTFGSLIFELEKENNSIRETVKEYIKKEIESGKSSAYLRSADLSSADLRSADLRSADLRSADLRSADLRSADLRYADLSSADLRSADLRSADLRYADLRSADLRYADLSYADLSSADLSYADLSSADLSYAKNKEKAYLPLFCKWNFSIKGDEIVIGCQKKTIEEWDLFFESNKSYSTNRDTDDFKQIEAVYLACKAYYQHLNK